MAYYAGQLNQPIVIERVAEHTVDEYGRPGKRWEHFCTLFAAVSDVSGREFFAAAAYQMEDIVTFTTRNVPCVTTAMRIVFQDVEYDIMEVNHLGYKGDFMTMKARRTEAEAHG